MISWITPEWFAAITSSAVTTIIGIAVGTYYKAKVEKAVQHNFDIKLEGVRTGFRKDEEALRAEIKAKGEQIAALRSGALAGLANRHAALDKRRLDAIDKLWTATVKLGPLKMAAKMTSAFKMEVALDAAAQPGAEGQKYREFATDVWNACGLDNFKAIESAHTERPYLPPLIWALYSANRQVLNRSASQLAAMRHGIDASLFADPTPILDLVKSALPHQTEFIEKFGTGGLSHLIDEMEEALLREIQRALHNLDADQASLEQAAAIIKAADKLAETSIKPLHPPSNIAI